MHVPEMLNNTHPKVSSPRLPNASWCLGAVCTLTNLPVLCLRSCREGEPISPNKDGLLTGLQAQPVNPARKQDSLRFLGPAPSPGPQGKW